MTADPATVSPVRRRILDRLAAAAARPGRPDGGLSAAELAGGIDLHVTTVRFHLHKLIDAGLVTTSMEAPDGVGRPRRLYRAVSRFRPAEPSTAAYQALTRLLARTWIAEDGADPLTPDQAGGLWARENANNLLGEAPHAPARSPGQWLGKVGLMLDLLHEWGYRPSVATEGDGRRIFVELLGCPFADLARERTDLVCGIHHGLLQGSLRALGENDIEVSLTPFVTPDSCHALLTTRTPFDVHLTQSPKEIR
jgi:predicted ArsR family transcriptional regulator